MRLDKPELGIDRNSEWGKYPSEIDSNAINRFHDAISKNLHRLPHTRTLNSKEIQVS